MPVLSAWNIVGRTDTIEFFVWEFQERRAINLVETVRQSGSH